MRAAFSTHLVLLDLITRIIIILSEKYKSWDPHYAIFSGLLLLPASSAHIVSSEPSASDIACYIPLLNPPRFYHFNNITYYKLESTLSLTSALDGGFHGLAHGEIYKYGCPHGKIVSSQLLLWPPQIQIQSSTLRPQTLPFYSTMCTSVSVKATGKVFYAICQSVGSSGTLRCVVGWTVPYVSRGI